MTKNYLEGKVIGEVPNELGNSSYIHIYIYIYIHNACLVRVTL
jgi:hypothetical protein